jgi:hypothetical protein
VLNETFEEDGAVVYREACRLGCEGIVSKRLGSPYRSGRSPRWVKVKNPKAPAVKREADQPDQDSRSDDEEGALRRTAADHREVGKDSQNDQGDRDGRRRPNKEQFLIAPSHRDRPREKRGRQAWPAISGQTAQQR